MFLYRDALLLKIPFRHSHFFYLSLLQGISLGAHNVVMQASCCLLDTFVLDTCLHSFGCFTQQLMISSSCCAIPVLLCTTLVHSAGRNSWLSPSAKMSNWWPVPIWSSGSQAKLSERQEKWDRQLQGGVLEQNDSPERCSVLHLFGFQPKSLWESREFAQLFS